MTLHLFINALAASAGGGLTYLRNVVPHLNQRTDAKTTILLDARFANALQASPGVTLISQNTSSSVAARFLAEQREIPGLIRRSGAQVLLSTGNFALLASPVRQILLSRNALYTSRDFCADLRERGDYRLWLDNQLKSELARLSVQIADLVIAPSAAFAQELQRWTGRPVTAVHHGFDRDAFTRNQSLLSGELQEKLDSARGALCLLFVSHYNYYRNFETLIRAVPFIKQRLGSRRVVLFFTCNLGNTNGAGPYRSESAARLVRDLGLSNSVVELGAIPYGLLHRVYAAADIYVTPAYAESFAHPLVEAMSSAMPIVASDIPVHREVCGAAALFFERFSPRQLAERVIEIAHSPQLATQLSKAGAERSTAFSWKNHVEKILVFAKGLIR